MTLDDGASTLNVSEGHLKDLIRDGEVKGWRRNRDGSVVVYVGRTIMVLWLKKNDTRVPADVRRSKPGEWFVDGPDVRARRRRLAAA